jgi:hypothetical protein
MCRFTVFKGKGRANAILLSNLILKPHHSIIKQSYACTMRVTDFMANSMATALASAGTTCTKVIKRLISNNNNNTTNNNTNNNNNNNNNANNEPKSLSAAAAAQAMVRPHSHANGDERHPGRDVLPNRIDVAGDCDVDDDDENVDVGDDDVDELNGTSPSSTITATMRTAKESITLLISSSSSTSSSCNNIARARTSDSDLNACESVVLRKRADPCVFTSITPAWNNINLRRLSDKIRSSTIFAHVRAATPGLITSQTNCHPFQYKQFMFMHNGAVAHWETIKRALLFSSARKVLQRHSGLDRLGALLLSHSQRNRDSPRRRSTARHDRRRGLQGGDRQRHSPPRARHRGRRRRRQPTLRTRSRCSTFASPTATSAAAPSLCIRSTARPPRSTSRRAPSSPIRITAVSFA